jgi:hypothetical protein
MKVQINKDHKDEVTSVDFLASNGRTSFSVLINADVEIEVRSTDYVRYKDNLYDMKLNIQPMSANSVVINKPLYD